MAKTYRRRDPDDEDDDGELKDGFAGRVPLMMRDGGMSDRRPRPGIAYTRSRARARDVEGYSEGDIGAACTIAGSHFGSKYFGAEGRVDRVGDEILCVPLELLVTETEDQAMTDANVRMLLKDATGNDVAGHRPGYVVSRNGPQYMNDRAAKIRALQAYEQQLVDAWRHPSPEKIADEQNDLSVCDAEAHRNRTEPRSREEIYRLYDEELRSSYKRG